MKHVIALAIKSISTFILLYIILGVINDVSFGNVFLITAVLGVAAYIVGDMLILPRTNNTIATIADFGLALMVIWLMSETLTVGEGLFAESLIAAVGVGLFEFFFHRYLLNNVVNTHEDNRLKGKLQYQTEASEEIAIVKPDVRKNHE